MGGGGKEGGRMEGRRKSRGEEEDRVGGAKATLNRCVAPAPWSYSNRGGGRLGIWAALALLS